MSGLSHNGEFDDVLSDGYVTGTVTATTTEVEAKVGASPLSGREVITLHNKGSAEIFYGPTGVTSTTGTPLKKNQFVSLPLGDAISLFVITDSGTATVIVQEIG
jgi:hypothetical protein